MEDPQFLFELYLYLVRPRKGLLGGGSLPMEDHSPRDKIGSHLATFPKGPEDTVLLIRPGNPRLIWSQASG